MSPEGRVPSKGTSWSVSSSPPAPDGPAGLTRPYRGPCYHLSALRPAQRALNDTESRAAAPPTMGYLQGLP